MEVLHRRLVALNPHVTRAHGFGKLAAVVDQRGQGVGVGLDRPEREELARMHDIMVGMKAIGGSEPMRRITIFRIASVTKPITAAAAMILVEECALRLDEPVDPWLPELADRRVLGAIDSPLDDTVPANRPIALRDLLTFRLGIGAMMVFPPRYPVQQAMAEAGVAPGPTLPAHAPDELMKRFGSLLLVHQPGERRLYNSGSDILGVLIARVTGTSLEEFLRERIFAPLGMNDTCSLCAAVW